jgi:hypothetical protein
MKIKTLCYTILLAVVGSSCTAPAAPTLDPVAAQNTIVAAAFTFVAETQAAIPTSTPLPPTEIPTQAPTETALPSPTLDALQLTPTGIPTFTAQSSSGNDNSCNKPLVTWEGPSASFTTVNETSPRGKIILMMSVATKYGECGWLHIYSDSFSGPPGTYSAGAFVEGKKNFKVFGAFEIKGGGWKIIVRNDVIVAQGSCYPNC